MSEFTYKRNLRPKESHPMLPMVQQIFVAAGPDYVKSLMNYLANIIEEEANREENPIKPEDNLNGVLYETFRKATEGEPLNDRYLMGAGLYIAASLIPIVPAMEAALESTDTPAEASDETA